MYQKKGWKIQRSSGTVYVEKPIPYGKPVSIIWVENPDDVYVGFMANLKEVNGRDGALEMAAAAAMHAGMDILGAGDAFNKSQRERAVWEAVSYEEACERFGARPDAPMLFLDEGGIVSSYADAFHCPDGLESTLAKEKHAREKKKAVLSAATAILVYAAVLGVSCVLAEASTPGEIGTGLVAFWSAAFMVLGVIFLVLLAGRLPGFIYREIVLK